MDHKSAHLMEFTKDPMETTILESKFTHEVKEGSLHKSENGMHNKEQHQQSEYFKALGTKSNRMKRSCSLAPQMQKRNCSTS